MFKIIIRVIASVLLYVMPFSCHATDTLDCMSTPYSVMLHVGYSEDGDDFLADLLLYKEGFAEPIAIYYNNDLLITAFKWLGVGADNIVKLSSTLGASTALEINAINNTAVLIVNKIKFPAKCSWVR